MDLHIALEILHIKECYCTLKEVSLLGAVDVKESDHLRVEGPSVSLGETLRVKQPVTERAAQCCRSSLYRVGHVVHQR